MWYVNAVLHPRRGKLEHEERISWEILGFRTGTKYGGICEAIDFEDKKFTNL